MTKRKWFDKETSLEEGEVILTEVDSVEEGTEEFDQVIEQESDNVEVTVSAEPAIILTDNSEPTADEIKFAKQFTGTPTPVDYSSKQLAQSCVAKKLLAEFGDDGFARGSKWFEYCKR